ncbi:transcription-repair coupling factor [bacterium]|nr:transcription-repair coupling factor [candidate division CSSED10-310 bacterium]
MKSVWTGTDIFKDILETVCSGLSPVHVCGQLDASGVSFVAELSQSLHRRILIVAPDGEIAARWVRDMKFFLAESGREMVSEDTGNREPAVRAEAAGRVILFPEFRGQETDAREDATIFRAHLNASLHRIQESDWGVAIVPASFLAVRMEDPGRFHSAFLELRSGADYRVHDLMNRLMESGYQRVMRVETPGDFAYRGGILDVYIPLYSLPVRIEFFGDEIVSIREFDALTQRSISRVKTVRISSAADTGQDIQKEPFFNRLSHWFGVDVITVWLDPDRIIHSLTHLIPGWSLPSGRSRLPGNPSILWDIVEDLSPSSTSAFMLPGRQISEFNGDYRAMVNAFRQWIHQGYDIIVVHHRETVRKVVSERLTVAEIELDDLPEIDRRQWRRLPQQEPVGVTFVTGMLSNGFLIESARLVCITERDIVGRKERQPWRRADDLEQGVSFQDLHPGDLVVHVNHGIGRYDGLHRLKVDGKERDFLLLRYADDQKLYLPVDRLNHIQKYQAASSARPPLDKIGGVTFEKRKKKVRESVLKLAAELLKLFSQREVVTGFSFPPDDAWQREFELGFEYEETPDQLRAIVDIKEDMQAARPMDRIVCGDVGYGKTEVAMRAAFKAAVAGRQVAVLVPTTILAQQHFRSFQKRFQPFPVKIAMLSRFLNDRDRTEVIKQIADGSVDVVIGTHALLADSVRFANLGLLIIDEEHRFGVKHKERLKQMRTKIDVLTLTATPIPRTLNMSLLGLREISLINTPPETRLPIRTHILKFNRERIREAILDEVNRGGQVFFVHNRVQSIGMLTDMLRKLVPEVRFAIAHGQMSETKLEAIMLQFLEKEFDVLVCTTIIESGLDISSVNTIIINRADQLGLAQLYQLRGRVGRDRYQAVALLLVPASRIIRDKARERLSAIKEAIELGSGFRLATRDLDLRGAGDLLGANQHGHISAVGFDMYCRMIREAVQDLRGEHVEDVPECDIRLPYELAIPQDYIEDPAERLELYRRFSFMRTTETLDALMYALRDRYGDPPAEVLHLAELTAIRITARVLSTTVLEYKNGMLIAEFHDTTPLKPETIMTLLVRTPNKFQFSPPRTLFIRLDAIRPDDLLRKTRDELEALVQIS